MEEEVFPDEPREDEEIVGVGPQTAELLKQLLDVNEMTGCLWISSLDEHRTDREELSLCNQVILSQI